MESLNKLIQVFKLHHEQILLSVMLAGLAAAVWFLYEESIKEEQTNASFITGVGRRKVQGVKPVDLSSYQNSLKMVQNPPALALAGVHNVFNPVKWVRRPGDGLVIKVQTGKEVGPEAMTISKVTPLYYIISLDRIAQGGYVIGVTREGAERPIERRKQSKFVTPGSTNQFFTLREVKGPPEDPTELVLELADTKESISLAKTKEYKRVVGYEVDLKYPVENKNFANQRVGSTITVAGDQYNIIAISENEVVLSARLNDKKY